MEYKLVLGKYSSVGKAYIHTESTAYCTRRRATGPEVGRRNPRNLGRAVRRAAPARPGEDELSAKELELLILSVGAAR